MKLKNNDFGLTLIARFEFAALMVAVYGALGTNEIRVTVRGFADDPDEADCANGLPALEGGMRVVRQQAPKRCLLDLSKLRVLEKIGVVILEAACAELRARDTQISLVIPGKCEMTDEITIRLSSLVRKGSLFKETSGLLSPYEMQGECYAKG